MLIYLTLLYLIHALKHSIWYCFVQLYFCFVLFLHKVNKNIITQYRHYYLWITLFPPSYLYSTMASPSTSYCHKASLFAYMVIDYKSTSYSVNILIWNTRSLRYHHHCNILKIRFDMPRFRHHNIINRFNMPRFRYHNIIDRFNMPRFRPHNIIK